MTPTSIFETAEVSLTMFTMQCNQVAAPVAVTWLVVVTKFGSPLANVIQKQFHKTAAKKEGVRISWEKRNRNLPFVAKMMYNDHAFVKDTKMLLGIVGFFFWVPEC